MASRPNPRFSTQHFMMLVHLEQFRQNYLEAGFANGLNKCFLPKGAMCLPLGGLSALCVAQYVLYVTHWSACTFYFIASQYGLDQDTWIGRHFDDVVDMPIAVR